MKAHVYSWRLSTALKVSLEEAARAEQKSVAQLLEEITEEWLARPDRAAAGDSPGEQERLRAGARKFIGAIAGGDPDRAQNARRTVRARLAAKRQGRAANS